MISFLLILPFLSSCFVFSFFLAVGPSPFAGLLGAASGLHCNFSWDCFQDVFRQSTAETLVFLVLFVFALCLFLQHHAYIGISACSHQNRPMGAHARSSYLSEGREGATLPRRRDYGPCLLASELARNVWTYFGHGPHMHSLIHTWTQVPLLPCYDSVAAEDLNACFVMMMVRLCKSKHLVIFDYVG